MKRLFVCFMLINALVYSKTLMLANGTLKLNYSDGNSGITNIMNMADGTTYITQIREGIYINNRFMYPTKTELNYVKGTGIISAINYYENDIQTNQHIYMTDRRNLIYLENKVNNPQGQVIHIFYKISPNIKMGRLDIVEKNYKYEDFYFSISNEKDIYFAGESDLINLSLAPLGIKRIKKPEKDIVLFFEPEKGSKLILSPLKINSSYFEYSVTDELRTWETWLKQEKGEQLKRSLITLKMLQNRDGSVFSFDRKRERLKADEMLYVAEAFTNLGYYDNAKRILTYFLTGNKNENSEYLISSYEYSKSKEEIFKTDRFGKIKSYYNSALYLYVFSKYINKSGDTAFFNVNGKELETRVYNYILSKIKNGELEGDSGIAESGNYKKNIATYSMVYLGLTEYKKLLEEDNNSDSLKEIDETIKSFESYFRLNFITNEKLKKSIDKFETPKLKETHYLNQGLVRNNNEYKILIRNLVREYWSSEDLSSVNELEFIKKLELINYSNTLRKRVSDLNKKMEEKNNLFLNKYNEIDVEATAKYLLLQEFFGGEMKILNEIEAILFLKGKELEIKELQNFFKLPEQDILDYLKTLKDLRADSGLNIRIESDKVSMITNPQYGEIVYNYFNPKAKPKKLSRAALETLTIIAYNEALTKSDIEKIRGVNVDGVVNTLVDKKLVKVVGIKESMGKPKLYSVTDEFLKYLNINSIEELPNYEEVTNANAGKDENK